MFLSLFHVYTYRVIDIVLKESEFKQISKMSLDHLLYFASSWKGSGWQLYNMFGNDMRLMGHVLLKGRMRYATLQFYTLQSLIVQIFCTYHLHKQFNYNVCEREDHEDHNESVLVIITSSSSKPRIWWVSLRISLARRS